MSLPLTPDQAKKIVESNLTGRISISTVLERIDLNESISGDPSPNQREAVLGLVEEIFRRDGGGNLGATKKLEIRKVTESRTCKALRNNLRLVLIRAWVKKDKEEIARIRETEEGEKSAIKDFENARRLEQLCSFLGAKFEQFTAPFPEGLSRGANYAKPPTLNLTKKRGETMMVKITLEPNKGVYISFRGDHLFAVDYFVGSERSSGNHDLSMGELLQLIRFDLKPW